MKRVLAYLLVGSLLVVGVSAQSGPYAAQIQAALRSLLTSNQTITGTWTFSTPPVGAGVNNATYITQTANATLSAEQALGALATGILKSTTTTGVVSIAAAGTDYQGPITCADTRVMFADGANTVGCDAGLTYNKTTDVLTAVGGMAATGSATSYMWASSSLPITDVPLSNGGLLAGSDGLGTPAYITAVSTTPSGSSLYPSTIQVISGFGTLGTPTTVANGDIVGNVQFGGRGSTAWDFGAYLYGYVDGVVSGNTVPLGFQFWTGSDNSSSQQTLTLRASGTAEFIGDVQIATGKAIKTDTTTAHTLLCQAYDVDGGAYSTFCTATNGNTPTWNWAAPAGGSLTGNFTSLQVGSVSLAPSLSGTTGSIGGGALLAGACASGTVAVTNSTTSMTVTVSPNTYPGDGTDFYGYVSSNGTVTVKVCALVAVTPTAGTYNVRVVQ